MPNVKCPCGTTFERTPSRGRPARWCETCRELPYAQRPTEEDEVVPERTGEYAKWDRVRIKGENGYYWVMGYAVDGSVALWGGDKDPSGRRQSRAIMPKRLKADKRKIERKRFPSFLFDPDLDE